MSHPNQKGVSARTGNVTPHGASESPSGNGNGSSQPHQPDDSVGQENSLQSPMMMKPCGEPEPGSSSTNSCAGNIVDGAESTEMIQKAKTASETLRADNDTAELTDPSSTAFQNTSLFLESGSEGGKAPATESVLTRKKVGAFLTTGGGNSNYMDLASTDNGLPPPSSSSESESGDDNNGDPIASDWELTNQLGHFPSAEEKKVFIKQAKRDRRMQELHSPGFTVLPHPDAKTSSEEDSEDEAQHNTNPVLTASENPKKDALHPCHDDCSKCGARGFHLSLPEEVWYCYDCNLESRIKDQQDQRAQNSADMDIEDTRPPRDESDDEHFVKSLRSAPKFSSQELHEAKMRAQAQASQETPMAPHKSRKKQGRGRSGSPQKLQPSESSPGRQPRQRKKGRTHASPGASQEGKEGKETKMEVDSNGTKSIGDNVAEACLPAESAKTASTTALTSSSATTTSIPRPGYLPNCKWPPEVLHQHEQLKAASASLLLAAGQIRTKQEKHFAMLVEKARRDRQAHPDQQALLPSEVTIIREAAARGANVASELPQKSAVTQPDLEGEGQKTEEDRQIQGAIARAKEILAKPPSIDSSDKQNSEGTAAALDTSSAKSTVPPLRLASSAASASGTELFSIATPANAGSPITTRTSIPTGAPLAPAEGDPDSEEDEGLPAPLDTSDDEADPEHSLPRGRSDNSDSSDDDDDEDTPEATMALFAQMLETASEKLGPNKRQMQKFKAIQAAMMQDALPPSETSSPLRERLRRKLQARDRRSQRSRSPIRERSRSPKEERTATTATGRPGADDSANVSSTSPLSKSQRRRQRQKKQSELSQSPSRLRSSLPQLSPNTLAYNDKLLSHMKQRMGIKPGEQPPSSSSDSNSQSNSNSVSPSKGASPCTPNSKPHCSSHRSPTLPGDTLPWHSQDSHSPAPDLPAAQPSHLLGTPKEIRKITPDELSSQHQHIKTHFLMGVHSQHLRFVSKCNGKYFLTVENAHALIHDEHDRLSGAKDVGLKEKKKARKWLEVSKAAKEERLKEPSQDGVNKVERHLLQFAVGIMQDSKSDIHIPTGIRPEPVISDDKQTARPGLYITAEDAQNIPSAYQVMGISLEDGRLLFDVPTAISIFTNEVGRRAEQKGIHMPFLMESLSLGEAAQKERQLLKGKGVVIPLTSREELLLQRLQHWLTPDIQAWLCAHDRDRETFDKALQVVQNHISHLTTSLEYELDCGRIDQDLLSTILPHIQLDSLVLEEAASHVISFSKRINVKEDEHSLIAVLLQAKTDYDEAVQNHNRDKGAAPTTPVFYGHSYRLVMDLARVLLKLEAVKWLRQDARLRMREMDTEMGITDESVTEICNKRWKTEISLDTAEKEISAFIRDSTDPEAKRQCKSALESVRQEREFFSSYDENLPCEHELTSLAESLRRDKVRAELRKTAQKKGGKKKNSSTPLLSKDTKKSGLKEKYVRTTKEREKSHAKHTLAKLVSSVPAGVSNMTDKVHEHWTGAATALLGQTIPPAMLTPPTLSLIHI